jgi:hypothetical protein
MNNARLTSEALAPIAGGLPEFSIVIIYEGTEAGRRAKRLSDRLLREIGDQFRCVQNLWSFDVLSITEVRNAAAGIARAADVVVLSASGDRELAPHVEKWLELWAWMIDGTDPALVALFESADGECARKIRTGLRALARDKQLKFFPHPTFESSADPGGRRVQTPGRLQPPAFQMARSSGGTEIHDEKPSL